MQKDACIVVTGATGLAGSAIVHHLKELGYTRVHGIGSRQCDLTDRAATLRFFRDICPEYVFHMAGFVRGIMGNMENKAVSFLNNTLINTHTIDAAHQAGTKKIVAMGTVAAYPDPAPAYPITEDMIWFGLPHGSENSYGQSKRAMLAQLQAYQESYGLEYVFAISTNLYGPKDNFDIRHGHVIPSLVRKFYEAKQGGGSVSVWGNGSAQRDFMFIEDTARALVACMEHGQGAINIGTGVTSSIKEAVGILAAITQMESRVEWDESKPNGQAFRPCVLSKLQATGFRPLVSLSEGLQKTYEWYAANVEHARTH